MLHYLFTSLKRPLHPFHTLFFTLFFSLTHQKHLSLFTPNLPVGGLVSKMPQNEATAIDPIAGGTFSRLLFSDVDVDDPITVVGFDNTTTATHFTFSSDQKPPKMLCFGTDYINNNINVVSLTSHNSNTTTTDDNNNNNNNSSSSPSSTTNSTTTSLSSNSNVSLVLIYISYKRTN